MLDANVYILFITMVINFVSTDYKVAKVAFWFVPGFRV